MNDYVLTKQYSLIKDKEVYYVALDNDVTPLRDFLDLTTSTNCSFYHPHIQDSEGQIHGLIKALQPVVNFTNSTVVIYLFYSTFNTVNDRIKDFTLDFITNKSIIQITHADNHYTLSKLEELIKVRIIT